MKRPSPEQLITSFKNAIDLEQSSDLLQTNDYLKAYSVKKLANLGLAIINLLVDNSRTGLGGKTLIELGLDAALLQKDGRGELPSLQVGTIRVGDIVRLDKMSNVGKIEKKTFKTQTSDQVSSSVEYVDGVVIKIHSNTITVSVDEEDSTMDLYNNTNDGGIRMWIVKLSNSVTYKRMISSMNKLNESYNTCDNQVINILLGQSEYLQKSSTSKVSEFFDTNLNPSQREAVNFAINKSPVTIIHGPPGTGKTYTLIELIKQLTFNHNERVLVCGPSNISVDTILERLSPSFTTQKKKVTKNTDQLIRIGHPARLLPSNLQHSLDVLSKASYGDSSDDSRQILKDVGKEIDEAVRKVKKAKRYSERRALWGELKVLRKELRIREKKVVRDLLLNSKVILATLHGAGSYELTSLYKDEFKDKPFFDTIIIDEVSQSLEPQCWIPLINHVGFKRLIIAGDDMQLPPTLKSKDDLPDDPNVANMEVTLFDRLMKYHNGKEFKKLLNVQYRMNQKIMQFPSDELYDGKLIAADSVSKITLADLPYVEDNEDSRVTCVWYDTQGGDFPERSAEEGDDDKKLVSSGSKFNETELLIVIQHVKKLLGLGVAPELIGIISPYNAQVSLIKKSIQELGPIEVSTVDGFQGREKEVIIISLVRSNENGDVGFLRDRRRMNVAITRPKRHLCIIGDLELMHRSGVPFLKKWSQYVEGENEIYQLIYPEP